MVILNKTKITFLCWLSFFLKKKIWWRLWELNPRPKRQGANLYECMCFWFSSWWGKPNNPKPRLSFILSQVWGKSWCVYPSLHALYLHNCPCIAASWPYREDDRYNSYELCSSSFSSSESSSSIDNIIFSICFTGSLVTKNSAPTRNLTLTIALSNP